MKIQQLINEGVEKAEAEKEAPVFKEAQAMLLKWEDGDEEVFYLWSC